MFTPVVGELSAKMIFFPSSSRPAQLALSGVPVWSLYGAPWLQPVAISGKSKRRESRENKRNPLPSIATGCREKYMVRRSVARASGR